MSRPQQKAASRGLLRILGCEQKGWRFAFSLE